MRETTPSPDAPLAPVAPPANVPPRDGSGTAPAPIPPLGLSGHLRAFTLAMQDPATPLYVKAGFVVGVIYLLSPIDLIPEALLAFFGLADDALVLVALLRAFFTVPTEAHKRAAAELNR